MRGDEEPEELPIEIDDRLAEVMRLAHRSRIPEQLAKGPCLVHKAHKPEPLRTVEHHVWPLGMDGPDVDDNKIDICDTGHYNIHTLLDLMLAGRGVPTAHRNELKYARQGYLAIQKAKEAQA